VAYFTYCPGICLVKVRGEKTAENFRIFLFGPRVQPRISLTRSSIAVNFSATFPQYICLDGMCSVNESHPGDAYSRYLRQMTVILGGEKV